MLTLILFSGFLMFIEHTSLSIEGVINYYESKTIFGLLETLSPHLFGMGVAFFILTHFYAVIQGVNQKKFWLFLLFILMLVSNFSGFFIAEGSFVFAGLKLGSTVLMILLCFYLMMKINKN